MERPSYFTADARVEHDGRVFELTLGEQTALLRGSSSWHGPGDPSTWLCADLFGAIVRKYPDLPHGVAVELAARAFGIPRDKVIQRIRWHENYVRWHDGVEYSVLDDDVTE